MLFKLYFTVIAAVICNALQSHALEIISRKEWGARAAKSTKVINGQKPLVVVHHSADPPACFTTPACMAAVKSIQGSHQRGKGWDDIGYNFIIGGDGKIYEGRGFNVLGAHAPNYNSKSVGICLIGDWTATLPPKNMLNSLKELINHGVSKGYIKPDYKLLGHRQLKATSCPGTALFNELKTWNNFSQKP